MMPLFPPKHLADPYARLVLLGPLVVFFFLIYLFLFYVYMCVPKHMSTKYGMGGPSVYVLLLLVNE